MKDPFKMEHATYQDTGLQFQLQQQFIADHPNLDIIANYSELNIKISVAEFVKKFKENITTDCRVSMPHGATDLVIQGKILDHPILLWVDIRTAAEVNTFKVNSMSDAKMADMLNDSINEVYKADIYPSINWWFKGNHGTDSREVFLPPNTQKLHPEFYPDLGNPIEVLAEYMASDEAVLLLSGPPGTGKTTLLRYLITHFNLKAHVIYDETLMQNDSLFQSFLFSDEGQIAAPGHRPKGKGCSAMIIEDADAILTSRERDGNHLMSRFLNVSDGLIKLPNRKLIFTTNILNHENMDQAILRPGRCFAIIDTRALSFEEAKAAAKVAGMPEPTIAKEYTLAELFNPHNRSAKVKRYGMGF